MALFKKGKTDPIFGLLQNQSKHLADAAEMLVRVFEAGPAERRNLNIEMHEIEHLADEACHTVLRKVNQSFMLPFDRDDVHALSSHMDDCVDFIDEASDNMVLYKPSIMPEDTASVAAIIRKCAQLTHEEMGRFDTIDEATHDYTVEINGLENQADALYRSMVAELFNSGVDAVEVLKTKLILDALESAVDSFEELANVIESIAIKES